MPQQNYHRRFVEEGCSEKVEGIKVWSCFSSLLMHFCPLIPLPYANANGSNASTTQPFITVWKCMSFEIRIETKVCTSKVTDNELREYVTVLRYGT
mmetsp:Transcript_3005/g.7210  ORF Transcript_3005/g.7210 Transcript_3005/m.7210 type:complete len:96 (-) Transcript_3005:167-454(-)